MSTVKVKRQENNTFICENVKTGRVTTLRSTSIQSVPVTVQRASQLLKNETITPLANPDTPIRR